MSRLPAEHPHHALEAVGDGGVVVDQGHADVLRGRVDAALVDAAQIAAGERADAGLLPELERRLLAVADVEPEEEAAGRAVEIEFALEHALGGVELADVERAIV